MIYIKKSTLWQYLKHCSFKPYLGFTWGNRIYIYQLKYPLLNKYFNVDRLIRHEKLHVAINLGVLKVTHKQLDGLTAHGLLEDNYYTDGLFDKCLTINNNIFDIIEIPVNFTEVTS